MAKRGREKTCILDREFATLLAALMLLCLLWAGHDAGLVAWVADIAPGIVEESLDNF